VHVIGLSPETSRGRVTLTKLEAAGRWRFNTWNAHTSAYLDLFVKHFNQYARRDSEADLVGIHALVHLRGSDLADALVVCDSIRSELLDHPQSWRVFIGLQKGPNGAEKRIEPLVFRGRALACVARLRALISRSLNESKSVVCGSGAYYRALYGISQEGYYS
jgi:hypothetical protein